MFIHVKTATMALGLIPLFMGIVSVAAGSTDFSSYADAYLTKLTSEKEFSGTVLVATNGNVIFAKGYGLANREYDIPATTNTIFNLGSVTKQFTAMCIVILQEEHKLNVTNRISRYLEKCPESWRNITIHHLLTHTSGIPDFCDSKDIINMNRLPTTPAATINLVRDKPLDFEPGTKWHYSNSGYVILGHIIEQVTGMSYEQVVTDKIFKPLGMNDSGYDHLAKVLPGRASGYAKDGTNILHSIPWETDLGFSAGALYSTVGDMLVWDKALYSNRLVQPETLEAIFTPTKGYGYGWISWRMAGRMNYLHTGGWSGFICSVVRFPKERVYIVVLSNFDWAQPGQISLKLSQLLFNTGQKELCLDRQWLLWTAANDYYTERHLKPDDLIDAQQLDWIFEKSCRCPLGTSTYAPFKIFEGPKCPHEPSRHAGVPMPETVAKLKASRP